MYFSLGKEYRLRKLYLYLCVMKKTTSLFSFIFFFLSVLIFAQNKSSVSEIVSQTNELGKAINSNDEKKQAEIYIAISDTYYNQNNFSKSEENLLKAKTLYEKTNDKNGLAAVSRKLAQTQ